MESDERSVKIVSPIVRRYNLHNHDIVSKLVSVCQGQPNCFHWQGDRSMLWSLRCMLLQKYGEDRTVRHIELLDKVEQQGSPREWALLWILFASVDDGLRQFLSGTDDLGVLLPPNVPCPVRQYVGTDNVPMFPADPFALVNYLTSVSSALRNFVWNGATPELRTRLYFTVTQWWQFGGRAMC